MRATHICRPRVSANMGILYLDKVYSDDVGRIGGSAPYRSRVLCIVPDMFLDLSSPEIVLVWPQKNLRLEASQSRQSAKDTTVKIAIFPSARSNVPVIIDTGLQGVALLDFQKLVPPISPVSSRHTFNCDKANGS